MKRQAEERPSARPISIVVRSRPSSVLKDLDIILKKGEVLYIQSATLGGGEFDKKKNGEFRLSAFRSVRSPGGAGGSEGEVLGFRGSDNEIDDGECYVAIKSLVITECNQTTHDFTYPINVCLDAAPLVVQDHVLFSGHPIVALKCEGHADWHLMGWVGQPGAIPQLGVASGLAAPEQRTFPYLEP